MEHNIELLKSLSFFLLFVFIIFLVRIEVSFWYVVEVGTASWWLNYIVLRLVIESRDSIFLPN